MAFTIDDLRAAKAALRDRLFPLALRGNVALRRRTSSVLAAIALARESVHGVGIGQKVVQGKATPTLCVQLYVVQKLAKSLVPEFFQLPAHIAGIPTDVIETPIALARAAKKAGGKKKVPNTPKGTAVASSLATSTATGGGPCFMPQCQRQRPVVAGISASHGDVGAGTIGFFCSSPDDPAGVYMVSNNHVFAHVNQALLGSSLFQPSINDGATFGDVVAQLVRYEELLLGGSSTNLVDAALARLGNDVPHQATISGIGAVTGVMDAAQGMPVRKHGRTTGLTTGSIGAMDVDQLVTMDAGDGTMARFDDQLRVDASGGRFADLGDSGSAVVHGTQPKILGLFFATPSDGSYGLVNKIQHVMSALSISIP